MKKLLIVILMVSIQHLVYAQVYNPYIGSCAITPIPLYNTASNGTGQLSFNVGNTGTSALPLISNQEMVITITLSRGIPNHTNPVSAIGGSFANHFNWLYDAASKTFQGTQNQIIPASSNGGIGNITIQYKVVSNSISSSPQNGFNINITPPPYTNGVNLLIDDQASVYTFTILRPNTISDVGVTQPNITLIGNVATNDISEIGTVYNNPSPNTNNPSACMPTFSSNGTYTFTCSVAGEYIFDIPICDPPYFTTCNLIPLIITVIDPAIPITAPLAIADHTVGLQSSAIIMNVKLNDYCLNGSACILGLPALITMPSSVGASAIVNANGTITYTPATNFFGKDSLRYAVCDNQTPNPKCDSEWVYITVLPTGNPNTTNNYDDILLTQKGIAGSGNVKTNDKDAEGNIQTITAQNTTAAGKGTLVLTSSGTYTFTPVSTFIGSVDFVYTSTDNGSPIKTSMATLHLLVFAPIDTDGDGLPNSTTDNDDDGDGIVDINDPLPIDTDNDGSPNWQDNDDDGDGILDINEAVGKVLDTDNDGLLNSIDTDDDADAVPDNMEQGVISPLTGFYTLPNSDADALPDLVDPLCLPVSSVTNLTICANLLPYQWNTLSINAAGTYTVTLLNVMSCDSVATLNLTVNACQPVTLNLTCLLQGYYIGNGMMSPTLANQFEPTTTNACDSIDIELRTAMQPYDVVSFVRTELNQNGTSVCLFPYLMGNFYIVINHRNALQTWSALPVSFLTSNVSYDFSVSNTQAYGQNMIEVSPGIWAIYSGDIIKDENMDLLDFILLEADVSAFNSGYFATDLNGDGNVDLLDGIILEENIGNFIYSIHP